MSSVRMRQVFLANFRDFFRIVSRQQRPGRDIRRTDACCDAVRAASTFTAKTSRHVRNETADALTSMSNRHHRRPACRTAATECACGAGDDRPLVP